VIADENSVHVFNKKVFGAKNLMISIKLTKSSTFARYSKGELMLRPRFKDIGNYTEIAKIVKGN
jgi:hypothetical protein